MPLPYSQFYQPKYCLYSKPIKGFQSFTLDYRFQFNSNDADNEINGSGNYYDFWG